MAPYTAESISSDEEDAPESFSLAQSKRTIKQQDQHLRSFEAAEKEKKKEKNRERDRKLKERSAVTKKASSRETKVDQDHEMNVETRMERAMRDARDEMNELEDGSDLEGLGMGSDDEDEEGDESDEDEDEEMESAEEDDSEEGDSEENQAPPTVSKPNPNHIPDHLFASAFTSQASSLKNRLGPQISESDSAPQKSRKRTRSSRTPKDLIVGYVHRLLYSYYLELISLVLARVIQLSSY